MTAGSAVALGGVVAQSQSGGASSADLPIAVQMYTLRDLGSVEEQFRFAADSGFNNVETVGTHDLSVKEMNALLDETGLSVISSHVDLNTLRTDLESVVAFNEAIGNTTIVMPYLGEEDRPQDAAGWQTLGAELGDIGAQLKEAGMQLAYHNHDFEMEEVDGKLIIDHLLNAADPENLMWQADVAWIDRGGQDPAQLLRDHAGRVISIHAKDNYPEGEGEDEGGFATVGSGRLDWDAVLPAADEAGVQYYIVEHDSPVDYQTIADSYEFLSAELPAVLGQSDASGASATSEACATYGLLEPHPAANALTEEERVDGWELLFDGQSLDAWRGFKQDATPTTGWEVLGGCLVRAAEGGGDIITKKQYDDFELTLEWRVPTGQPGNSGIFFNVTEEGEAVYETGPEMQILNNAVHPDGHDTRTSAGANYALNEPTEVTVMPAGMFNYARILVEGNHVEHWLNGVKVVDYELHSPEWEERVAGSKFADWPYGEADVGHIALQDHGDLVWFRNIKIRPLNASSESASGTEAPNAQAVQGQATQSQAVQPVTVARDPRLAEGELPVALQMYSLRTFGSVEGGVFEEQLALAADAGYGWIETVGTHDLSAEAMNALLQKYDLRVASMHVDMDTLQNNLGELIAFNKALGNTNVVMPYAEAADAAGWRQIGADLNEVGAKLREAGIMLAYHNHAHEMEALDGKLAIDHLLGAADPENLKLQVDLAWVARGGQDPAAFVAAHAGRIVSVHAKDNAPEGENEDQDGWAEVGYGTLAWDTILPAVRDAGAQWFVVEHDNPRDHLTVAQRSYEFLQDELPEVLGLGPQPGISERIGGALTTVDELTRGALGSARAASSAEDVGVVKARVGEVFTAVWGVDADMARSGDADAQFLGWNERWRVSDPEHGIVGNGLYAREQLRDLQLRRDTPEAARQAAQRADVSLSNVIGWMWLDDGLLYGEKTERPRVDLTYIWDYPVDFWNSTADTGWLFETYAQALNILKTDYEGDTVMAQAHAQALVPLLEKALTGVDADGDGKVAPVRQEGGLNAVMAQAEAAGWTGTQAQVSR